ncbi:MAG: HPr family phosphocarrier protein [Proteocatella sp.]
MYRVKTKIVNEIGLHARSVSEFVKIAANYKSTIFLEYKERPINAKSVVGLLASAIPKDSEVAVYAMGMDEENAVNELVKFIENDY